MSFNDRTLLVVYQVTVNQTLVSQSNKKCLGTCTNIGDILCSLRSYLTTVINYTTTLYKTTL